MAVTTAGRRTKETASEERGKPLGRVVFLDTRGQLRPGLPREESVTVVLIKSGSWGLEGALSHFPVSV